MKKHIKGVEDQEIWRFLPEEKKEKAISICVKMLLQIFLKRIKGDSGHGQQDIK